MRTGLFHSHRQDDLAKIKLELTLPIERQLGTALERGDCFFDSIAQSLANMGKGNYTAKFLRMICHKYVVKLDKGSKEKNLIYQRFLQDAKRGNPNEAERIAVNNYQHYLANIQYTADEIDTGQGLNCTLAIWGVQDIDGRILREQLGVDLHVLELHKTVEGLILAHQLNRKSVSEDEVKYDTQDTVHIANFNNHFVPILAAAYNNLASVDNKSVAKMDDCFFKHSKKRDNISIQPNVIKNEKIPAAEKITQAPLAQTNDYSNIKGKSKKVIGAEQAIERQFVINIPFGELPKLDEIINKLNCPNSLSLEHCKQIFTKATPNIEIMEGEEVIGIRTSYKDRIKINVKGSSSMDFSNLRSLEEKINKLLVQKQPHQTISTIGVIEGNITQAYTENDYSVHTHFHYSQPSSPSPPITTSRFTLPHASLSEKTICFQLPPNNAPYFIGRDKKLKELQENFHFSNRQVIVGQRGIGKRQLALRYAHQAKSQNRYKYIVWFNVGQTQSISSQYQIFAKKHLGLDGIEKHDAQALASLVYQTLSASTLFIFDSATIEEIKPYLPQNETEIHFLVTSWMPNWGILAKTINLELFSEQEAINFLATQGVKEEECKMLELGRKLDFLPLALSQSVSCIQEGHSIQSYLEEYEENPEIFLRHKPLEGDLHPETIWNTVIINIHNMEKCPSVVHSLAVQLFKELAWLSGDAIPFELLRQKFKRESPYKIREGLKLLKHCGLIQFDNNLISVHQLTQRIIQLQNKDTLLEKIVQWTIVLYEYGQKIRQSSGPESYYMCIQYISHFEALLLHISSIENLSSQISFPDNISMILQKVNLSEILIELYLDYGINLSKAEVVAKNLICTLEKFRIHPAKRLALARKNLGKVYLSLGELKRSELELKKVLNFKSKKLSAKVNMLLGVIYCEKGKFSKSIYYLKFSLSLAREAYGENHLTVDDILLNLANVYLKTNKYELAKDYYIQVLNNQNNRFGEFDFRLCAVLNNLGCVYKAMGQYKKAKELYEKVLEIEKRNYRSEHWETAGTLLNLGDVLSKMNKLKEAKDYCKKGLRNLQSHFGEKHIKTEHGLMYLGIIYTRLQQPEKAKAYFEQVVEMRKNFYGESHVDTAHALSALGNAYCDLGELKKAEELNKQALHIIEAKGDKMSSELITVLGSLGKIYYYSKKFEQSLHYHSRSLKLQEETSGKYSIKGAEIIVSLALVCYEKNDYNLAIRYLRKAREILKQHSEHAGYNLPWIELLGNLEKAVKIQIEQINQTMSDEKENHLMVETLLTHPLKENAREPSRKQIINHSGRTQMNNPDKLTFKEVEAKQQSFMTHYSEYFEKKIRLSVTQPKKKLSNYQIAKSLVSVNDVFNTMGLTLSTTGAVTAIVAGGLALPSAGVTAPIAVVGLVGSVVSGGAVVPTLVLETKNKLEILSKAAGVSKQLKLAKKGQEMFEKALGYSLRLSIQEAGYELARMYEYQIGCLANEASIKQLAKVAVARALSYLHKSLEEEKKSSKNSQLTLGADLFIKGALEGKCKKRFQHVKLQTLKPITKWYADSLFTAPGIRQVKMLKTSQGLNVSSEFYAGDREKKYGYRAPIYHIGPRTYETPNGRKQETIRHSHFHQRYEPNRVEVNSEVIEAYLQSSSQESFHHYLGAELKGQRTKPKLQAVYRGIWKDADLKHGNFESVDFSYAQLPGVHAEQAQFKGTRLTRTQLKAGHFEEAKFNEAHLEKADLSHAHLEKTTFKNCSLPFAKLDGAYLSDRTVFSECLVEGVSHSNMPHCDLEAIHSDSKIRVLQDQMDVIDQQQRINIQSIAQLQTQMVITEQRITVIEEEQLQDKKVIGHLTATTTHITEEISTMQKQQTTHTGKISELEQHTTHLSEEVALVKEEAVSGTRIDEIQRYMAYNPTMDASKSIQANNAEEAEKLLEVVSQYKPDMESASLFFSMTERKAPRVHIKKVGEYIDDKPEFKATLSVATRKTQEPQNLEAENNREEDISPNLC